MTGTRKQDADYLRRCQSALETLGIAPMPYINDMSTIVPHAMKWLAKELDNLHVTYYADDGWQVSTIRTGDVVDYCRTFPRDEVDGTLAGALLLAVERVASGKKALAEAKEFKDIGGDDV